jgi:4-hydroxybenzoate polyprenyltransferase
VTLLSSILEVVRGLRLLRSLLYKSVILLTAPLFVVLLSSPGAESPRSVWLFLLNMYLYLFFIYILNDYADRDQDAATGKQRTIGKMSGPAVAGLTLLVGAGNILLGYYLAGLSFYLLLLVIGLASGAAYSVRPLRVKERGAGGVLFPGLPGRVVPILMACALYGQVGWWVWVLLVCESVKCTTNILFHQIVDHDADRLAGIRTFATDQGKENAERYLKKLAYLGVVAALAMAVTFSVFVVEYRYVLACILVLWIPAAWAAPRLIPGKRDHVITALIPMSCAWPSYTVFFLSPLWLGLIASLRDITFAPLAIFVAVVMVFQTLFYVRYEYR